MISKEQFRQILDRLEDTKILMEQVNTLFRNSRENIENNFCNAAAMSISHEGVVIFLLGEIFNDQQEDISYFMYELDFGKKYKPGSITSGDEQIDLSDAGKLYDYLTEKREDISDE